METILSWSVLGLHYSLLFVLCLFGLHRLSMVLRSRYYRFNRKPKSTSAVQEFETLPAVTVQIPVFNERNVALRIIEHATRLDYPEALLQIQVVDDSTDETADVIRAHVNELRAQGVNIEHVHRENRQGFKAGALRDAMATASGEFIAIFDADFIPNTDFLLQTVHHFTDPEVAMVQGRWGHLNINSNRLTKCQAVMLDSHFALEQQVRYQGGMLFNFNGTAGIWRVSAIVDAGHWSADTLTEDLDLSYRAQLNGWKLVYRNDIVCPAELPSDMRAFKSQQHRWAKGGVQVMKKLLGTVWRSNFSVAKKVESTFHLSNNFAYFVMLIDTLFLLIPSLIAREYLQMPFIFWLDIPLLMLASGSHLIYLFYGQVALNKSKLDALVNLPFLLLLGICLAFNNARAALEALANQESEFVRTPKSGETADALHVASSKETAPSKKYITHLPSSEGVELASGLAFFYGAIWSLETESWMMLPFFILLGLGFSISAWSSLRSRLKL